MSTFNIFDYTQKRVTAKSLERMIKAVNAYLYSTNAKEYLHYSPRYEWHAVDVLTREQYEKYFLGARSNKGGALRNLETGTGKECQQAIIAHYGNNT